MGYIGIMTQLFNINALASEHFRKRAQIFSIIAHVSGSILAIERRSTKAFMIRGPEGSVTLCVKISDKTTYG